MKNENYAGIDYGNGFTNIDTDTGIRFGVIAMHSLCEWAYDEFEPVYVNTCPHCGRGDIDTEEGDFGVCRSCDYEIEDGDFDEIEPVGYVYEEDGYVMEFAPYTGDIFVLKSPYVGRFQFCSPCAPGAVHLECPCDDGELGYCLPNDWFEGETAPYAYHKASEAE